MGVHEFGVDERITSRNVVVDRELMPADCGRVAILGDNAEPDLFQGAKGGDAVQLREHYRRWSRLESQRSFGDQELRLTIFIEQDALPFESGGDSRRYVMVGQVAENKHAAGVVGRLQKAWDDR